MIFCDFYVGCISVGVYFNFFNKEYGVLEDIERYVGDFGNVIVGEDGVVKISIIDKMIDLVGF